MISGRALFFGGAAMAALLAAYVSMQLISALLPNSGDGQGTSITLDDDGYDRSRFGGWIDADGDCMDTRDEILAVSSSREVQFDDSGCRVLAGYWVDIYSGEPIEDASKIDIDHLVSLSHAWRGGASRWSDEEMVIFANDFENLIVTSSSLNRSKSNASPLDWLPPNDEFQCDFVERFIMVSEKYQIAMPQGDEARLQRLKSDLC